MVEDSDPTLARARRVQRGMLPRAAAIPGLEIHPHYAPCEEIGGDFYDVIVLDDDHIALVIGDVVGHGVAAALLMASAKKSIQAHSRGRTSPAEILGVVAEDLAPELLPGMFLTAMHVILNVRTGAAVVARAGHIPLLHLAADGSGVTQVAPNGLPIGATPPALMREKTVEQRIQLAPGDQLMMLTDGVIEAQRGEAEMYGLERAADAMRAAATAGPEAVTATLLESVREFSPAPLDDDVTLLTVRWRGAARSSGAPTHPTNLDPADGPPPGHEADHRALCDLLRGPDARVVALTGPVGSGKSTLARVVGRTLLPDFPGGSWLVDLRDAETPQAVAFAVARTFGLPLNSSNATVDAVGNLLRNRPPLLIVCDAFEQAAGRAAESIGAWKAVAPDARFLIAARETPAIDGTHEHQLSPLALPPLQVSTLAELQRSPAAELFLNHLHEASGGTTLADADAPAIAAVIRSVGGLPLALELGARRLALEASQSVATTAPLSDAPDLETALGLTFDSLHPAAQQALMQLAIFRGGFTFESASSVLDPAIVPGPAAVLDVLQSLESNGLVAPSRGGRASRYVSRPGVQDFAQRRWATTASTTAKASLDDRFIQHCVDLGAEWGPRVRSPAALDALDRLESETQNFFTAYDLAFAARDPERAAEVILALAPSLELRGPADERAPRLDRARGSLAGRPDTRPATLRTKLSIELSRAHRAVGEWKLGTAEAEVGLAQAKTLGDPIVLGRAYMATAEALTEQGEYAKAHERLDAAEAIPAFAANLTARIDLRLGRARVNVFYGATETLAADLRAIESDVRALGCPRTLGRFYTGLAVAAGSVGQLEEACELYEEAEAVYSEAGDPAGVATVLGNLGNACRRLGRYELAHDYFSQAEHLDRDLGNKMSVARHLSNRAAVFHSQQRYEDAVAAATLAIDMQHEVGNRRGEAISREGRGTSNIELGNFDEAREDFTAAITLWESGGRPAPKYRFMLEALLALTANRSGEPNEARRRAAIALELTRTFPELARTARDVEVVEAWAILDALLPPTS